MEKLAWICGGGMQEQREVMSWQWIIYKKKSFKQLEICNWSTCQGQSWRLWRHLLSTDVVMVLQCIKFLQGNCLERREESQRPSHEVNNHGLVREDRETNKVEKKFTCTIGENHRTSDMRVSNRKIVQQISVIWIGQGYCWPRVGQMRSLRKFERSSFRRVGTVEFKQLNWGLRLAFHITKCYYLF